MLKKIKTMLEYRCYPVWLYDENDDIIDTLLPEELRNDTELDKKFDDLQARYDALFVDTEEKFDYIGFSSEEQKNLFLVDWERAVSDLRAKLDDRYEIVDDIDIKF